MLFLVFKLLQIPCPLQCCTGLLLCFSNLLQIPRLLRCCTDLASCCSKLQLIPFVHCGAAQIWHCAAQSCSLFLLFIAVLHRSGIVLLKAAADSFCSLRCCTDLASCCSKLPRSGSLRLAVWTGWWSLSAQRTFHRCYRLPARWSRYRYVSIRTYKECTWQIKCVGVKSEGTCYKLSSCLVQQPSGSSCQIKSITFAS